MAAVLAACALAAAVRSLAAGEPAGPEPSAPWRAVALEVEPGAVTEAEEIVIVRAALDAEGGE